MGKWIGAVLIIAACGGYGLLLARHDKREEKALSQLLRILRRMVSELSCRVTALPQLLRQGAADTRGELTTVFLELADQLELRVFADASDCVAVVLRRHPQLPESVCQLLEALGSSLGCFDLEGQLRELEFVQAQCARLLEAHSAGREERIRNFQTLGLCAGAALAILLL